MKQKRLLRAALSGGAAALVLDALSYLMVQINLMPRLSFMIFDWTARNLPGNVITAGIDALVSIIRHLNLGQTSSTAKQVELSIAVVTFILLGTVFGVLVEIFSRGNQQNLSNYGAAGGVLAGVLASLIYISLNGAAGMSLSVIFGLIILFTMWGWGVGSLLSTSQPGEITQQGQISRRGFLWIAGLGSAAVLVTAAGISLFSSEENPQTTRQSGKGNLANASTTSGPAQSPPEAALDARIPPAPGTRPELTSNQEFYRIDINTVPPEVDGASWRLNISGMVANPLSLSLDDLHARPSQSQAITLECISNPLGGDLTSSSLWTGVRLKDILAEAGLQDGVQALNIEAVDGFYESVPIREAMDECTLLVYAMNNEPLPARHGFPLRIYIPDHFGMKQPKWITKMEAVAALGPGYWVDRGWSPTAVPPTTSVIDAVNSTNADKQTGTIPVGGIAYAGARGISKVEIQIDDGAWQEAELRDPPLSPLTWVQWRFDWPAPSGSHILRVRAYDGEGNLQIAQDAPPHPNGATGLYEVREIV